MTPATTKRAFQLAWPASLAAMITPLLGVVDTAVLARAATPADIAGVALAGAVISLLYWPLAFLRMSTSGLVAQHHGEADEEGVRATLVKAATLGGVLGLAVLLLSLPITRIAGVVMADDAISPEALGAMGDYLAIRFLAAPFAIATTAAIGWLSGQGRTGLMSLAVVGTVLVNAALDVTFVLYLDMGVQGIALGTALAETAGALAVGGAILFVLHKRGGIRIAWMPARFTAELRSFFSLNANIFLRTLLLAATFAWFMRAGSQFGDLTLAANQVLMQIILTAGLLLDGPAIAAESLIGVALGQRHHRPEAFAAAARATAKITAIGAGVLVVLLLVGKHPVLSLIIPAEAAPALRGEVEHYYLWAVFSPAILAFPFYLDGVFIGATMGRELRNSMIVAVVSFAILAFGLRPLLGNHGLWLAFSLYMLIRAGALGLNWGKVTRRAQWNEGVSESVPTMNA